MKLFELFEPEFKDTKKTVDYDRKKLSNKAYKDPSKDELGKGLYSRVRTDPHDPHMAIKSEKGAYDVFKMDYNAYYAWVKAISPYMKSNPYLPRVYVIDDRTDASGSKNPRYKMEKLYSPDEVNLKVLLALAEKLYDEQTMRDIRIEAKQVYDQYYDGQYGTDEIAKNKFKLYFWREYIANSYKLWELGDESDDENLKQALAIVKSLITGPDAQHSEDMHDGNFMIRITPHGPQLVFTDPIA
jgi:hypothetical protein